MRITLSHLACWPIAAAAALSPAAAATVSFSGSVINLCVLTISTPGLLGLAASGTTLSSEETGGVNSVLVVAATGSNPSINFTAPALTGPAGSMAGASHEIAYTSIGGAGQAWTSAASNYTVNRLIDTVTIKARSVNTSGFVAGTYGIAATATCQQ